MEWIYWQLLLDGSIDIPFSRVQDDKRQQRIDKIIKRPTGTTTLPCLNVFTDPKPMCFKN